MDPTSRTVAIFTMVIVIRITVGISRVSTCPTEEGTWIARASDIDCDGTNGMSYHCIKNHKNELLEGCLRKEKIPPGKGGCPWVFIESDGSVIFGATNTVCDDQISCPDKNHTEYYTDQLYKYPGCIQSDYTTTSTTAETTKATTTTTIAQNTIVTQASKPNSETPEETVAYIMLCILMPVPFISLELWNIKKRKYDVPSKNQFDQTVQNKNQVGQSSEDLEFSNIGDLFNVRTECKTDVPSKNELKETFQKQVAIEKTSQISEDNRNDLKNNRGTSIRKDNAFSNDNCAESPEIQTQDGTNKTPQYTKHGGNLVFHLLVHLATFMMFYSTEINICGKTFSLILDIMNIFLLFPGFVALIWILYYWDMNSSGDFYGLYSNFIHQLIQALTLNCIIKKLVQTIFMAIKHESDNYIFSIVLLLCMGSFFILQCILHWKKRR